MKKQSDRRCDAGACVKVQENYGTIMVFSSKQPETFVTFDPEEWSVFIEAVKNGDFDQ